VKVHIEKGTSAKNFFDLNKTRIFYEFIKPTFVWYTPSADRESAGSPCDLVAGTYVAMALVFTMKQMTPVQRRIFRAFFSFISQTFGEHLVRSL